MNPRSQSPETVSAFFMGRKVQLAGRRGCPKAFRVSSSAPGEARGHSWPGVMGRFQGLVTPDRQDHAPSRPSSLLVLGTPFGGMGDRQTIFSWCFFPLRLLFGCHFLSALWKDVFAGVMLRSKYKLSGECRGTVSSVLKIVKLCRSFSFFKWSLLYTDICCFRKIKHCN